MQDKKEVREEGFLLGHGLRRYGLLKPGKQDSVICSWDFLLGHILAEQEMERDAGAHLGFCFFLS